MLLGGLWDPLISSLLFLSHPGNLELGLLPPAWPSVLPLGTPWRAARKYFLRNIFLITKVIAFNKNTEKHKEESRTN